jgi:hypothetical protein
MSYVGTLVARIRSVSGRRAPGPPYGLTPSACRAQFSRLGTVGAADTSNAA